MEVKVTDKGSSEEENKKESARKKNRSFLLNESISASSVEKIIQRILEINKYDEEEEIKNPLYVREPIDLIIDSYGGGIYEGFALFGVIDTSVTPVHGYCYSKAMSMGFLLFIICHRRHAHRVASFMYHNGATLLKDDLVALQNSVDQAVAMVKMGDSYITKHTLLTQEKLDEIKKYRLDWYMFAEEAMENGIVDVILESKRNTYKKAGSYK